MYASFLYRRNLFLSDFICLFLPEIVCTKYIVVDLCQINVSQNPLKSTSLLYGKVEFFMFNMFSFMHDLTYQLLVHREKLINEWRMTPDKLLKGCTPLIFHRVMLLTCVAYTYSTVCSLKIQNINLQALSTLPGQVIPVISLFVSAGQPSGELD